MMDACFEWVKKHWLILFLYVGAFVAGALGHVMPLTIGMVAFVHALWLLRRIIFFATSSTPFW